MMTAKTVGFISIITMAAFGLAGCGAETPPPPSSEPLRIGRRELTVISVSGDVSSGLGLTDPMIIRVEDNPSGFPSLGIIESYARGAGNMVRASAWIAAIVATQAQHQFVNDYEFYIRAGFPYVEGPSAGMLFTVGFLAAIRGDEILPATTMTGTINPDGTCGPVGAIPGKMRAARADKIERFAYPTGSRIVYDGLTGRQVDLVVLGRELGFKEVQEVSTLEEAYRFLTGRRLETIDPVPETEMALSFEMQQQLQSRARSLGANLSSRIPVMNLKLQRSDQTVRERLGPLIGVLNHSLATADQYAKNGWFAAAYWETILAEFYYHYIDKQIDFLEPLHRGDWDSVRAQIAAAHRAYETLQAFEEEAQLLSRRSTIGGRLNAIQAMGHYAQALVRDQIGDLHFSHYLAIEEKIKAEKPEREEARKLTELAREELISAIMNYAIAQARIDLSREIIGLAAEEGPTGIVDMGLIANYGRAYGAAASAGLAQVDSVVVRPWADRNDLSLEVARQFFARHEPNYPFITSSFKAGAYQAAAGRFKDLHTQALYQISRGYQGYLMAAELVNKYYSLEASLDRSGLLEIKNRRLLTIQLETARRRAREAATRCKDELGFIPSLTRFHYELGVANREGDDNQRIQALSNFWEARQIAEMALLLGGRQPSL